MGNKYKFFVVFHDRLKDEYYSPTLIDDYEFINVNSKNELSSLNANYKISNQYEFHHYYSLGKWYTESEVIYNVYKNSYLYENLDYIGFLQHDIDSSKLTKKVVDKLLLNKEHINFQPYLFDTDYDQKILMDINQPNKKVGTGINCYDIIINDYNTFYGTIYNKADLKSKTINLCSSFILKTELFKEMMIFISSIIESEKLDIFDTNRQNRIQGGYLERYYATWLTLKGLNGVEFKLEHYFAESTIRLSLFKRILSKLGLNR